MPINVVCGECGNKYRMPEKFAGRAVPCKSCGADIEVPGDDDFETPRPARRGGNAKKRKKSSGLGVWPLVAGVGIVGLLLVGGGVWGAMSLMKRPANTADGFAPGGVAVQTEPNGGTPSPAGSRFDAPVTGKTASPAPGGSQSAVNFKPNKLIGVGFGNVVGISDYWGRQTGSRRGSEFATLKEPPDALPPDVWTLEVDPPKEPLEFKAERKKLRVKVPVTGSRTTAGSIVFPAVPSRFVAVGENAKKSDVREVWDLGAGKKVKAITKLDAETADVTLSPDGRYFAGVMDQSRGSNSFIGVYDTEEQEIIGNVEVNQRASWLAIAMPRPNLLVAMETWSTRSLHAFEVPSLETLYTIEIGHGPWNKFPPVFSPGGKYLAWSYREHATEMIAVYDLDDGQLAGRIALPEYDISWWLHLHGLAFSPDGTELAAIIDGWECSKIVIYSMATGEIVDHMTFPKKLQAVVTGEEHSWETYNPLVVFPGNQRLLAFEHGVVDRGVGEVVFNVPRSLVNFPGKRWPLDESHLTVIDVANNSASVFVYELPEDKIKKATERISERRSRKDDVPTVVARVEDVALVDEAQVKRIFPQTTDWKLRPDGRAPSATDSKPLALNKGIGQIQQFAVSGGDTPKAAVMRGSGWPHWRRIPQGNTYPALVKSNRDWAIKDENVFDENRHITGSGSGKSRCWLDLYDLASGKIDRRLRLAYDADLIGLSPDGSRALLWAARRQDRLDVYDTSDGKLVASWEPEAGLVGHQLGGARMIDSERVATINSIGELCVWRIVPGEDRATAIRELSFYNATQPAVSPNGKYLGFSDAENYQIIDIQTGEVCGQVPDVGDVHGAAFHPAGTKLALLSEYKGGYFLFSIELNSGQVSPPFPVPVLTPYLEWYGDRYVLLDNRKLVDVEQKVVAWSYELPSGDHLPSSFNGRHWYIAPTGSSDDPQPVLAGVELPTSDAASKLQGVALGPEFVLQPGGSCSISLQLGPIGGYANDARQLATKALQTHQITVADNQPVTLVLSVTESIGATEQKEFISFGAAANQTVSVTSKNAICKVQFQANGEVAWEESRTIWNSTSWVTTEGKQSINEAIEGQYQGALKGFFAKLNLPPYVFTPKAANGIGKTTLTATRR